MSAMHSLELKHCIMKSEVGLTAKGNKLWNAELLAHKMLCLEANYNFLCRKKALGRTKSLVLRALKVQAHILSNKFVDRRASGVLLEKSCIGLRIHHSTRYEQNVTGSGLEKKMWIDLFFLRASCQILVLSLQRCGGRVIETLLWFVGKTTLSKWRLSWSLLVRRERSRALQTGYTRR